MTEASVKATILTIGVSMIVFGCDIIRSGKTYEGICVALLGLALCFGSQLLHTARSDINEIKSQLTELLKKGGVG